MPVPRGAGGQGVAAAPGAPPLGRADGEIKLLMCKMDHMVPPGDREPERPWTCRSRQQGAVPRPGLPPAHRHPRVSGAPPPPHRAARDVPRVLPGRSCVPGERRWQRHWQCPGGNPPLGERGEAPAQGGLFPAAALAEWKAARAVWVSYTRAPKKAAIECWHCPFSVLSPYHMFRREKKNAVWEGCFQLKEEVGWGTRYKEIPC